MKASGFIVRVIGAYWFYSLSLSLLLGVIRFGEFLLCLFIKSAF